MNRENRTDRRRKEKKNPSQDFINMICQMYGDCYDDREEDSRPGGEDWRPGEKAKHTSLASFKKELADYYNIDLSTAKIRKILVTGKCWSTERSRQVAELYGRYGDVKKVAAELNVSTALVIMYLPYEKTVYDLEDKSGGARRTQHWRENRETTLKVEKTGGTYE